MDCKWCSYTHGIPNEARKILAMSLFLFITSVITLTTPQCANWVVVFTAIYMFMGIGGMCAISGILLGWNFQYGSKSYYVWDWIFGLVILLVFWTLCYPIYWIACQPRIQNTVRRYGKIPITWKMWLPFVGGIFLIEASGVTMLTPLYELSPILWAPFTGGFIDVWGMIVGLTEMRMVGLDSDELEKSWLLPDCVSPVFVWLMMVITQAVFAVFWYSRWMMISCGWCSLDGHWFWSLSVW